MSASFDAYKIFYFVGKYKNITHAANSLFLSQSTVSRSIQGLEAELGCKLFDRTQHGVVFTLEGQTLFNHVSSACEQIFAGEEKVTKMQQLAVGSLRIAVSNFTFSQVVLPVIRSFHLDFPSVNIEIITLGFTDSVGVQEALNTGQVDLAVSAANFPANISAGIDITRAANYTDIIVANASFTELRNGSFSLSDLVNYPFAALSGQNGSPSYPERLFQSRGMTIHPEFLVDSMGLYLPIVKSCRCLAIIPAIVASDVLSSSPIFQVKITDELPPHDINILVSSRSPQSAARDMFIKQLKRYTATRFNRNT